MSKQQTKTRTRVTLSKASKRLAATILDPHKRGAFIRSQLDAENTALMSRFSKNSRDSSDSN